MKRLLSIIGCLVIVVFSPAQEKNLDYFVNQGLANSPLLKDYQSQLQLLSLDSQIMRASLRPQVNGISNNSYAPVIGGWGYDDVLTNGQQVSAMVGVSKSLISNKSLATQIAGLGIQSQSAVNASKISEQDLKKLITDQYIVTFGGQLQLDFSRHINDLLQKEDSLLRKLTQDNVYKQTDYLAFAVLLQQQLLNTSQLEIQYNFDFGTLNYLAGVVDTLTVRLTDPRLNTTAYRDFANSVFYRQFILDSLKLANDKALIDINYRPKINLSADAGYNSSLVYKAYRNFGSSIGVNIAIPIYDGKQRKMQYSKIDIQERTRTGKRDFFTHQHDQQLIQLEQQLRSTDKLIDQINKQIAYTETLITVNEKLLATGDIRLIDFILALSNYFTAKNLVTQNYISRLKIINQLNYWAR
ncbi:MAG: TolC family protein [Bacteroidota bacterium]|nr:TolC family protein [Bacteroidota bacterium]